MRDGQDGPQEAAPAPSDSKGRLTAAECFLKRPRDDALEAFPCLGPAFQVLDEMVQAIAEAKPAKPEIGLRLLDVARSHIATCIRIAASLPDRDALAESTHVEVAYANLVQAANDRRTAALRCHQLDPRQRNRLIAACENVMNGDAPFGIDLRASRMLRAQIVARELARLDPRHAPNPFVHPGLRAAYDREHG